jgi:hypothetical protein
VSKPRYFVLLLGRETVEETIGNVEETHGPVVERHDDEHGGPVQTAKLYPSLCGKLVFGIVEIEAPRSAFCELAGGKLVEGRLVGKHAVDCTCHVDGVIRSE